MFNNNEFFKAEEVQIDGKKAFTIQFPYELKDEFRSAFKSAKWNPRGKHWVVGPRSGKRLAQWIDVVAEDYEKYAKEKAEQEALEAEADLQEEHIKALQLRLHQLNQSLAKKEFLEGKAKTNKEIIDALNSKIEAVGVRQDEVDTEIENTRNENRMILSTAVNLAEVESLTESIVSVLGTVSEGQLISKYNKSKLDDLQFDLKRYIDELEEMGIEIKYLNECYSANGNRPDRDLQGILKMRENEAIYDLIKL